MSLAVWLALGCSSEVSQGDSETHWLSCKTFADCQAGKTCEEKQCVTLRRVSGAGGAAPLAAPSIPNPSGRCVAPDSGARAGYHSPEAGEVWLPDCHTFPKREYYRVFARSEASAYIIPRPDDLSAKLYGGCSSYVYDGVLSKYGLCDPETPQTVTRVNDMLPADAIEITRYFNSEVLFEVDPADPRAVTPFPLPSDILDACALHPGRNSAAFEASCKEERRIVQQGLDMTQNFDGAELAPLLNELYGIGDECASGDAPARQCTACGDDKICLMSDVRCSHPCQTDDDCPGADRQLLACERGICQASHQCN